MIRFADNTTEQQVRNMWKSVFCDSECYMNIYFREKYRNENTLIYFDDGKAVSSLQMLPFNFTFHGTEIGIAYFSGLCTLPEVRRKGFMRALIEKSFNEMGKNGVPLVILVPQETAVMTFYRKLGFEQTFDTGTPLPDLRKIVEQSENLQTAYQTFDSFFRHQDMTVQKSFEDFRTIVAEAKLFDFPTKERLIGMSRIIDVEKLLSVFAEKYPQKEVSIKVSDEIVKNNNAVFTISNGRVIKNSQFVRIAFNFTIQELTPLLLGYQTLRQEETVRFIFPEKNPQMHFMLE